MRLSILMVPVILAVSLAASAADEAGPIGLEVKDRVNVVYHLKVVDVRPDGVSKGVHELRHLLRLYDRQGVTRDKRDIHAVFDADGVQFVLNDAAYSQFGKGDVNPNVSLIAELIEEGVAVEVCGQRMERDKLEPKALLPGVCRPCRLRSCYTPHPDRVRRTSARGHARSASSFASTRSGSACSGISP